MTVRRPHPAPGAGAAPGPGHRPGAQAAPGPADAAPVHWAATVLTVGDRDIPLRVYRPRGEWHGWLVWAHGGSWQAGSVEDWHPVTAALARSARCTVVSVGYRLAPRHTHPAALLDVLEAHAWACEQAARDGSGPVAVGGDSAGGTLAAAASVVLRDQGRAPAAQVLAYPPLDPACGAPSYRQAGAQPSAQRLLRAWGTYLGAPGQHDSRLPSTPWGLEPGGLPPAILAVGSDDPVRQDVAAYAAGLRGAGVPVRHRVLPAVAHAALLRPGEGGHTMTGWLGAKLCEQLRAAPESAALLPPPRTDEPHR